MIHRRSFRRLAAGFAVTMIATGAVLLTTAAPAQADSASIAFVDSEAEMGRQSNFGSPLSVGIDDATAAAHPQAVMRLHQDALDGGELGIVVGLTQARCDSNGDDLDCEVTPREGIIVTRWDFQLWAQPEVPSEGTVFTAELVEDGEVLASAQHTVRFHESERDLTAWNETVSAAPGQTAEFAPSFANDGQWTVAGVVIDIYSDDHATLVAPYDNCVNGWQQVTCVVPAITLGGFDTVAVAAETPLGLRLDEPGRSEDVCGGGCFQGARVVGVAEARRLLEQLGGDETGNVLRLEPADRPAGEPAERGRPNLFVDIVG